MDNGYCYYIRLKTDFSVEQASEEVQFCCFLIAVNQQAFCNQHKCNFYLLISTYSLNIIIFIAYRIRYLG